MGVVNYLPIRLLPVILSQAPTLQKVLALRMLDRKPTRYTRESPLQDTPSKGTSIDPFSV